MLQIKRSLTDKSTVSIFRHVYFCHERNDDEVRYVEKHDFGSVLLHSMLSNANLVILGSLPFVRTVSSDWPVHKCNASVLANCQLPLSELTDVSGRTDSPFTG